jgi:hypothetical protein
MENDYDMPPFDGDFLLVGPDPAFDEDLDEDPDDEDNYDDFDDDPDDFDDCCDDRDCGW